MRFDESQSRQFSEAPEWKQAESRFVLYELAQQANGQRRYQINSFSGGERNRLFIQDEDNFADVSCVSNVDFRQDGRGFSLFDFDRDGWIDMAVCSPQSPALRLVKNTWSDDKRLANNQSVFIRLVGGHDGAAASNEWSSRDAVGAEVVATIGDSVRAFRYAAGEGLSSQNSSWIHIGLGSKAQVDALEVRWPSGKVTKLGPLAAGSRKEISERE